MAFRAWTRALLDTQHGDGETQYLTWQALVQVPPYPGQRMTVVRTLLSLTVAQEGLASARNVPQYSAVPCRAYVEYNGAETGSYPTPSGWPAILQGSGQEIAQPVIVAGLVPAAFIGGWTDQVVDPPATHSTWSYHYTWTLAPGEADSHAMRHYEIGGGTTPAYVMTANVALETGGPAGWGTDVAAGGVLSVLVQYDRDATEG